MDSPDLVHRFREQVEDGTRCGPDQGLSLCLTGVCEVGAGPVSGTSTPGLPQEVGCDLELRSGATLDYCGVCGGDATTCQGKTYGWQQGEAPKTA